MASDHDLPAWANNILLLVSGGGLGAAFVASIRGLVAKPWTKVERDVLIAAATKDTAVGQADMLQAMSTTFTDVTGGLRHEIECMQAEAANFRQRATAFEVELKAALKRVSELEDLLKSKDETIARLQKDVDRTRQEIEISHERVIQQEGEIRNLNALIDGYKRATDDHSTQ